MAVHASNAHATDNKTLRAVISWQTANNFTGLTSRAVAQLRGGVPGPADYEASIGTGTLPSEITATGQLVWSNAVSKSFTFDFDRSLNRTRLLIGAVAIQHLISPTQQADRIFLLSVTRAAGQFTRWTNLTITATATAETASPPDCISTGNGTAALLISGPFQQGFVLTGSLSFQWTGAMPLRSNLLGMAKMIEDPRGAVTDELRRRRRDPVFGYLMASLMGEERRRPTIIGRGDDDRSPPNTQS